MTVTKKKILPYGNHIDFDKRINLHQTRQVRISEELKPESSALEAMSLGAPVIASNATSIPEIVGGAGILVDATNAREIFVGMEELMQDFNIRHNLSEHSKQQASKFSWKSSASLILDCYAEVLSRRKNDSYYST